MPSPGSRAAGATSRRSRGSVAGTSRPGRGRPRGGRRLRLAGLTEVLTPRGPGVVLFFVSRRTATPMCPLRPGDPCGLCVPGADGPHNCPTVRLVLEDPEMREMWLAKKAENRAASR